MPHFSSVVKAMIAFFEMTPAELIAEWKKLTSDDKREFAEMLTEAGYTFDVAAKA